MSSDTNSLAHTKWNCKYHIVFAPKYRRQVIYGKIKGILELFCVNYVKEALCQIGLMSPNIEIKQP